MTEAEIDGVAVALRKSGKWSGDYREARLMAEVAIREIDRIRIRRHVSQDDS